MANKALGLISLLFLVLSIVAFFMPLILGSSSELSLFFLISFGLLLFSLILSSINIKNGINGFGVSVFTLIFSIAFFLFLAVAALVVAVA